MTYQPIDLQRRTSLPTRPPVRPRLLPSASGSPWSSLCLMFDRWVPTLRVYQTSFDDDLQDLVLIGTIDLMTISDFWNGRVTRSAKMTRSLEVLYGFADLSKPVVPYETLETTLRFDRISALLFQVRRLNITMQKLIGIPENMILCNNKGRRFEIKTHLYYGD